MSIDKESNLYIETLINIYTIEYGKIKILLLRKKNEPFKGYWILPGKVLNRDETLEDNVTDVIINQTGLLNVDVEQFYTFSNLSRCYNDRVLATAFIGTIDCVTAEIKKKDVMDQELGWFDLDNLPKIGCDHEMIIEKCNEHIVKKLTKTSVLKNLFPSDFTLPELQELYEQILNRKFDRRNFRKKFINMGLIEDTLEYNIGCGGRPAKLYRFKEKIKEIDLF